MQDTVFPADSSSGWMDMSKEVRFQGIQGNSSRHTDGASASQKPGTDDMDDKISMDTAGFQYAVRIALKDGISDDIRERIIACFDNYLGKADDISENPDELLFAGDESGTAWARECSLLETTWISSIRYGIAGGSTGTTWARLMM